MAAHRRRLRGLGLHSRQLNARQEGRRYGGPLCAPPPRREVACPHIGSESAEAPLAELAHGAHLASGEGEMLPLPRRGVPPSQLSILTPLF